VCRHCFEICPSFKMYLNRVQITSQGVSNARKSIFEVIPPTPAVHSDQHSTEPTTTTAIKAYPP
jgi:hypothetical protein